MLLIIVIFKYLFVWFNRIKAFFLFLKPNRTKIFKQRALKNVHFVAENQGLQYNFVIFKL